MSQSDASASQGIGTFCPKCGNEGPPCACPVPAPKPLVWSREMAVELCTLIQSVSPKYNAHPALTGGLLYKEGMRKDCDIVIYRRGDTNGERPALLWIPLWAELADLGLKLIKDYGYVKKCLWSRQGAWLPVDVLDVVQDGGNYPESDSEEDRP